MCNKSTLPHLKWTSNQMRVFLIILLLAVVSASETYAQIGNAPANTYSPWITDTYPSPGGNLALTTASNGPIGAKGDFTHKPRVLDNTLTTAARWTPSNVLGVSVASSASFTVTDGTNEYPAGTYAGFVISNTSMLSIGATTTISTLNNGTPTGESFTSSSLASVPLGGDQVQIGFISTLPFDAIRVRTSILAGLSYKFDVYYAVIKRYVNGPALTCNTPTFLTNPTYPMEISNANTGIGGIAVGSISNTGNFIDSDQSNSAKITGLVGVNAQASIAAKSEGQSYPIGTFAGVSVNSGSLLGVGVASDITIATFLNGAPKESFSNGSLVGAGTSLLTSSGKETIGFLTTQEFDEVKITFKSLLTASLSPIDVYGVVVTKFCAGPALVCNTTTSLTNPAFPVFINGVNTGTNGLICAGCSVVGSDLAIDANPSNFAEINLVAGVAASGSIAIANAVDTYPENTFAGFDYETSSNLATVDALGSIVITLYNDGVKVQEGFGQSPLAGIPTDLLSSSGRTIVGIVSQFEFDEVQITFNKTVSLNLSTIKIYGAVIESLCVKTLECNTTYTLNQPNFPTVVNFEKTGFNGVAQVGSSVSSPWNLITSETDDYASITMGVGALSAGTIAIYDPISIYPAGAAAGFSIDKVSTLLLTDAELLTSITVATYLDGVLQESKNAGGLLNLEVLGILSITTATDPAFVGFITTKSFDEIRISYLPVVGALSELRVYNALIDTRTAMGGGGLLCFNSNADFNVTYPNVATPGNVSTNDFISTPATYGTEIPAVGNPAGATIAVASDGSYTFTATNPGIYEYVVPICLDGQTSGCATEKLTITVLDQNSSTNPPIANPDYTVVKGSDTTPSSVTVNVRINDGPGNDGGTLGTPTIPVQPSNGTASVDGNGNIVFTPVAGFYGEVTIPYQVCETPSGLCRTAELVVTVIAPDAPNTLVAVDDYMNVAKNVTLTTTAANGVRANDTDPDNDVLTVTAQNTSILAGTLALANDGSYTFTPTIDYVGPANFIYEICDGNSCEKATLYILVTPPTTPLPVTLSQFNVTKIENVAEINWTTVSESNSAYFELQRSSDASSWNVVNKQSALGESKRVVNYSFIDNAPLQGSNYYRLKMVDIDATYSYSKIRSINFEGVADRIIIGPNPASDQLNIVTDTWDLVKQIDIVDLHGKIVFKTTSNLSSNISLKGLKTGIYIVKIYKANGQISVHKIVVNK